MKRVIGVSIGLGLLLLILAAIAAGGYWKWNSSKGPDKSGKGKYVADSLSTLPEQEEVDDRLEDKSPAFDENRIDSRLLEGWEVNQSDAVIRVNSRRICPGEDADLLTLFPSFDQCKTTKGPVYPSANLLDGSAKQFDDGLFAALNLACYRGELGGEMPGAVDLVSVMFGRLPDDSPARPFLGAALELAGRKMELSGAAAKRRQDLLREFEANQAVSKPISFYSWTPELERFWRFSRFLQQEFCDQNRLEIPLALAKVLSEYPVLAKKYSALLQFHDLLTNSKICLSVSVLTDGPNDLAALAKQGGVRHPAVSFLPPSTSRESELFEQVFPGGVPNNTAVMTELIKRVRSGGVDLQPKPGDGWCQYQVYALESLLKPAMNQESERLLLTADYKIRLMDAFRAMYTKRWETHVGGLYTPLGGDGAGIAIGGPDINQPCVTPRLRLEPCPTVYLRTARAYAFLQNFLRTALPPETLRKLHGLRESGIRDINLDDELEAMRLRTYGFYLVSCEDIGMAPKFLDGEAVDQEAAGKAALEWIAGVGNNPDLARDTRVALPIYYDPQNKKVRLWITLGVRLAKLQASYERPPKLRPHDIGGPWRKANIYGDAAPGFIAVEEFAEVEMNADRIPNRAELRTLCDKYKDKHAIVEALQRL